MSGRPLNFTPSRGDGGHYLLPFNSALVRIAKKMAPSAAPPKKRRATKIPGLSTRHSQANPKSSKFSAHDVVCALVLRELGVRREVVARAIGCHITTLDQWAEGTNRRLVTL